MCGEGREGSKSCYVERYILGRLARRGKDSGVWKEVEEREEGGRGRLGRRGWDGEEVERKDGKRGKGWLLMVGEWSVD